MKSVGAALLLTLPLVATAGELILHVGSWHADRSFGTGTYAPAGYDWNVYTQTGELMVRYEEVNRPVNNVNPGIGYVFDSGWVVGIYRNSYYRPSVYGGYAWSWKVGPTLLAGRSAEVGVTVALATGYEERTGNPLQPAAGLTVGIPLSERVTLRFIGAPGVGQTSSVAHFFVSYRF